MTKVKIGGRVYALYFTLDAMDEIEQALGEPITFSGDQLGSILGDRKKTMTVFTIFANQGEIAEGRDGRLTVKAISRTMTPGMIVKAQKAVADEIIAGARMETDQGEDEEVDVVLQEIKKNETGS